MNNKVTMNPARLHSYIRRSLRRLSSPAEAGGLRALLEGGGSEGFLTDLLFIELHAKGYDVSREFPIGKRRAADIALHTAGDLYIEVKQLHLKDGCKYAPPNLIRDLKRHGASRCLGVMYLLDERRSKAKSSFSRYRGANRHAKHDVASVLSQLPRLFRSIFPTSVKRGLLRDLKGSGSVKLYGFVVAL